MKITRRGWIVIWVTVMMIISLFTYATRDVCYVGEGGNALGYGSCMEMIDNVIEQGKRNGTQTNDNN